MDDIEYKIDATARIAVVGGGNVATHLHNALSGKTETFLVNPHTLEGLPDHSDIALIAVKDSAIGEVAQSIKSRASLIAHTSGSIPMDICRGCAPYFGVFYPLQTFTKGVGLNYEEIPFFIEADSEETSSRLTKLARLISEKVHYADSEIRKKLHLASVFACNFTNSLMGVSNEILSECGIDFRVLLPLLRQTICKLDHLSPKEAQTGPAARHDYNVIDGHLEMLSDKSDLKNIYRILSDKIIKDTSEI